LLGLLGTEIAESFALRIFDTFSSNNTISLSQYLKYVDVYHYGDEKERSQVTYQMMDVRRVKEVSMKEFEDYIKLLIAAIQKVHPSVTDNFFSSKDIRDLFKQIATNNKNHFTEEDFLKVYLEKPELISWIDYFKNNDGEVLLLINNNLKSLLNVLSLFFKDFSKVMESSYHMGSIEAEDLKNYDLTSAIKLIEKFSKTVDKCRKDFIDSANKFSIRSVFQNLTKSFGDINKKNPGNEVSPKRNLSPVVKKNAFLFDPNSIGSKYMEKEAGVNSHTNNNYNSNYNNHNDFNDHNDLQDAEETKNIDMTLELQKIDSSTVKMGLTKVKRKIHNTEEIVEENIHEEAEETFINENSDKRVNVHNIYRVPSQREKISYMDVPRYYKKQTPLNDGERPNEKDADISKIEEMIYSNYLINTSMEASKNEAIILDDSENKLKSVVGETGINVNMLDQYALNNEIDYKDYKKKNTIETKEIFLRQSITPLKRLKQKQGIGNLKVEEIQLNIRNESSKEDMKKFLKKMKILSEKTCQVVEWVEQSYKWVERKYLREPLEKVKKSVEEKIKTQKS
jgi:hypothetical protein